MKLGGSEEYMGIYNTGSEINFFMLAPTGN